MFKFVKRITFWSGILLSAGICFAYPRVVLVENWTALW